VTNTGTGQTGTLTNWSLTLTPLAVTTPQTFPLLPGSLIPPSSSLSSPLTITGQGALATVGSLSLQLNITDPNLANLSAVLIGPDGTTQVTLFNAGNLAGTNLVNTTFSDAATTSLSSSTSPYTGTFLTNDPSGLAKLNGQSINGTWTLLVINAATGQTGTLNSWSLLIKPAQAGASPVAAVTPSIPAAIPDASPSTLTSTLPVSGRGDALQIANLTAQLNITAPNLADVSAVLISPDGTTQVTLFNAGDLSGSTMVNTTFSAAGTTSITNGTSPYTDVFYVAGLSQFQNLPLIGTWTLQVTNIAAANTGTLVSWSLGMTPQIATPPQPAQAEGALF